MSVTENALKKIRDFISKEMEGKPQRLATLSGLHRNTLNNWNVGNWNPVITTIHAVESAIDEYNKQKQRTKKRKAKK